MCSYDFIDKTVYYLKESPDGFCYLGSLEVHAVTKTHLYNKDFSKCVAIDSIFESYKDAQSYMNALGIELYVDANKVGFKKIYSIGTDAR